MRMTSEEKKIVKVMKQLGTYKAEYMQTVSRLAQMREQYAELVAQYSAMDKRELNGYHKPVIIGTIEALRRDILTYERDLGMTPAALKKLDAQAEMPQASALADALRRLG